MIRLSLLPTSHPLGFQPKWVRSSTRYNPRFNLLMGRSRSFASTTVDCVALFRLGFPEASVLRTLTEPLTVTRRIIMQKARRHALLLPAIALRPLVGTWFQVHIPPLTGVLLIFRSLYLFTIGHQGVFSLAGWSPRIQSRFHVTRPTQGTLQRQQAFAYGSVTLYGRPFQIVLLADCLITPVEGPTTPKWKPLRFGLFPVRSPLLRKSIFLSFPAGTEMFQFSAFATRDLWIQSRSVRASRDHHLFDGYPGLIAVFRALQSLLTPRHPPCALCSLTTRIECSRRPTQIGPSETNSSRFNYGPSAC